MKKTISYICGIFGIFVVLLLYPLVGKVVDEHVQLSGVMNKKNMPEFSLKAIWDGTWQEEMESYLQDVVPGKNLMVKINSQVQYSVFDISSNANILIGKNKQLYEGSYLDYQMNIWGQTSEEDIALIVSNLEELQTVLNESNKELYVFITPSKVRYCYEEAPFYYRLCAGENDELAYDSFRKILKTSDIQYFDSVEHIDGIKEEFEYPLFYPTGIHWSNVLGAEVSVAFNEWLDERSKYELSKIEITEVVPTDTPAHPDADLYSTLNLFAKPDETYYNPVFKRSEGKDMPNVYLRGGSFMGQSLANLIKQGVFAQDYHFENNYRFKNRYSDVQYITTFNSYEELDVIAELNETDIVILEVNENQIGNMSWGFIDYVLENQSSIKERNE